MLEILLTACGVLVAYDLIMLLIFSQVAKIDSGLDEEIEKLEG